MLAKHFLIDKIAPRVVQGNNILFGCRSPATKFKFARHFRMSRVRHVASKVLHAAQRLMNIS